MDLAAGSKNTPIVSLQLLLFGIHVHTGENLCLNSLFSSLCVCVCVCKGHNDRSVETVFSFRRFVFDVRMHFASNEMIMYVFVATGKFD